MKVGSIRLSEYALRAEVRRLLVGASFFRENRKATFRNDA
jgi:hypothetical protein